MSNKRVLIIEDEEDIQELVKYNLSKEGYQVHAVSSGEDGLKRAQSEFPSLIFLDLMLPGIDGLEVCKALKNKKSTENIPIIIISAKGEESDIITGLELGADDYITKPFSPKILVARARSVLRRKKGGQTSSEQSEIEIRELTINPGRFEVKADEETIDLTFTEFSILHFLARHPGWVFTRYQIVDSVKGDNYAVTERSVDVQIVGLRKKLGKYGEYIETVRGVGYRFKE